MEMEWETRPPFTTRDWPGRSVPLAASSSTSPPSSSTPTSSAFSQRRRSSAVHSRPAAPPPNLPIPSVPVSVTPSLQNAQSPDSLESPPISKNDRTSRAITRLAASPNLTTVVSFPHASQSLTIDSSVEDLSDPPPRSYLHPSSSSISESSHDPPLQRPRESRTEREHRIPSSRRALTRALELAREAVQLDSMNDNPEAAVQAYGRSVALLSEVMERVRRGEDSTDSHRRRRRRSVAAQEEEIRRLQNIHDTYADRMNILSIIYSIPAIPYSSADVYAAMNDSTTPVSPTASASPSSDSSPQISHNVNVPIDFSCNHDFDTKEAMKTAMFPHEGGGPLVPGLPSTSHHPYAYDPSPQSDSQPAAINVQVMRSSALSRRPRASSNLPPPPPPPSNALPPAPGQFPVESVEPVSPQKHLEPRSRPRTDSLGHRPVGCHGLGPLKEERDNDMTDIALQEIDAQDFLQDICHGTKRDSHPLPPLPSPSSDSPGTPRNVSLPKLSSSPRNSIVSVPRPRGTSQLTTRLEAIGQPIINQSTNQGTIYQRRTTKSSAPPTSRSSSPADSNVSIGSMSAPKSSSLPGSSVPASSTGRTRSSSQPGPRPSLVGGIPQDQQRPPLPGSNINGTGLRKVSVPSKFIPNVQLGQLSLQIDLPQLGVSPLPAGPQSAFLPTSPSSPLPPAAPSDPLLKPYYLMNLLRITMRSSSGGYITPRLHVPHEVWSQGGAKLANVVDKVRVVSILCTALEDLKIGSSEYFGANNFDNGLGVGIDSMGKREADAWLSKLEEFSLVCDKLVTDFGKKLNVGEGFVLSKKTTWSGKLTRSFDKFTNGKNLDSPASYVRGLEKLFLHARLLDEHTKAVLSQPMAPPYVTFPSDVRVSIEQRLKRASEFFATVVLNFVIRDLSQLLDKYAKKCEKWLAE